MLQRKLDGQFARLKHHAFLVSLEYEEGTITPEKIAMRLGDSVSFIEGVGEAEVNDLGEVLLDEPHTGDDTCQCEKCLDFAAGEC